MNKAPTTRLLDLTCGWCAFVDQEDHVPDDLLPSDEIGALYQAAGNLPDEEEVGAEASDAAVRAFVAEKVLPILLRR